MKKKLNDAKILSDLVEDHLFSFTLEDLIKKYNIDEEALKKKIYEMKDSGLINKLWQEKYILNNKILSIVPIEAIIHSIFVQDYYIGLYWALFYWKLSDMVLNTIHVVTNKDSDKNNFTLMNYEIKVLKYNGELFGYSSVPKDAFLFNISDKEKTIVDFLYFHKETDFNYLMTILSRNRDRFNFERMTNYARRVNDKELSQRLGFILNKVLGIKEQYVYTLLNSIGTEYVYLNPNGPKISLDIDDEWKIMINMRLSS